METSYDSIWPTTAAPEERVLAPAGPPGEDHAVHGHSRDGEQVEDADVEIRDLQRDPAPHHRDVGPNGMTAIVRIAGASENIGAICRRAGGRCRG